MGEKKTFKLSKNSKKNLDVRKEIISLVNRVLLKSPHDFGVPKDGGTRTAQEQNNLYHQRDSKGRRITWLDGFNGISYHQSGNAFDIFIYDEHGACWRCIKKYKEVADLFKEEFDLMKAEGIFEKSEELFWGGDWTRFIDRPHFEIRDN